jgi:hypothetical protein
MIDKLNTPRDKLNMDENNKSLFIEKISEPVQAGIILSVAWLIVASFIYFDQLTNYPSSYNERLDLRINDYFKWDDDIERKDEALEYAKAHGDGAKAQVLLDIGFRFLKPAFSALGYHALIVLPILMGWLMAYIIARRRKYLFISISACLLFLALSNLMRLAKIYLLLCICIFIFWLLIKAAIYELSYIFYKAKEDAKNKDNS